MYQEKIIKEYMYILKERKTMDGIKGYRTSHKKFPVDSSFTPYLNIS